MEAKRSFWAGCSTIFEGFMGDQGQRSQACPCQGREGGRWLERGDTRQRPSASGFLEIRSKMVLRDSRPGVKLCWYTRSSE
jgi:hypothetical protein